MLPVLRYASDRREHSKRQYITALAEEFRLTEAERQEMLPSGGEARFDNRVAWTLSHLKKAGLLQPTRRAYSQITERGLEALSKDPSTIDMKYLMQFPEYVEFRFGGTEGEEQSKSKPSASPVEELPPHELIEEAYQRLRVALAADLLQQIKSASPQFFERLVVDLLIKKGYGGSRQDAGEAIGKSGDEGIDGIIKEDRLGLDVIYLQAKRWEGTVSRPEIQKFVGALHGQRARKGSSLPPPPLALKRLHMPAMWKAR
jgi:restriction system protein